MVRRWTRNAALAAITNVVGLLFRTSPLLVAATVSASPYGLLNRSALPFAIRWVAAVLILDLTRYAQHRLLHSIPLLWRLHQVHHTDEHFDLTIGVRFHPIESAVTYASYLSVVALVAPPFEAALVVELASVAQNFFSHANVKIPDSLEPNLRRILITPEMHRLHHSVLVQEQNTNFGAILPWWDRLFGTYRHQPAGGHERLRFGLRELETGSEFTLMRLLAMPFVAESAAEHTAARRKADLEPLRPPH
jgi:sterol desaturase/sphingolipid hydroxylase (fatty acid hydroxylase superfamily)